METTPKTAAEIFKEFKGVFTELPFEDLRGFIGYCETHARTERALFHISQVLLLNVLNGEEKETILELRKKVDAGDYVAFTAIHGEDMDIILDSIKTQVY